MKRSLQAIVFSAAVTAMLTVCSGNGAGQSAAIATGAQEKKQQEMPNHDHNSMNHPGGNAMTIKKSNMTVSILEGYLLVKDALVKDSQAAAAAAGNRLARSAGAFDASGIPEPRREKLMEMLGIIRGKAELLAKNGIDEQRAQFEMLTGDIRDLILMAGSDRTLYLQHCPMYKGNQGGSWLSDSPEIQNPLFGSAMLKCGSVKEKLGE